MKILDDGACGRRRAPLLLLAAALLLPSVASCSRRNSARNVLLLTLDTTRVDHLSCYGSRDVSTPAIDSIAKRGVRFDEAFTTTPITRPAHASLLTGLYPLEHRVRDNPHFRLVSSYQTLAETLKASGFETAAFVSSFVLKAAYGMDQGFDHFDEEFTGATAMGAQASQRLGEETTAAALAWFRARPDRKKPFFAWVHYYDPHMPYIAPEPFRSRYASLPSGPYAAEVAYMDSCVGTLLDGLKGMGLLDDTIVVALSDHGEGLGDHGEMTHGYFVYDETMRIALVMSAPGALPDGLVVKEGIASIIDVMPTVLDLLSLKVPPAVHGRSLLPVVRGGGGSPRQEAILESFGPVEYGWSRLRALRTPTRKMIDAPRPELYDVIADPKEKSDLASAAGSSRELLDMRERLKRLSVEYAHQPSANEDAPDEALPGIDIQTLAQLGYMGGERPASVPSAEADLDPKGTDPKDRVALYEKLGRAYEMLGADPKGASELYAQVIQEEPDNPIILVLFANSLIASGQLDRASEVVDKTVKLDPDNPTARLTQASLFAQRGDLPKAVVSFREAIARFESLGADRFGQFVSAARIDLASTLLRQGKRTEAEEEFAKARKEGGDRSDMLIQIGSIWASQREWKLAAELLQTVVAREPANEQARLALAQVLVQQGNPVGSSRVDLQACKLEYSIVSPK